MRMQPWNQPSVRNGFSQQLFAIPFSSRVLRSKRENPFTVQHFQRSILWLVFIQELNGHVLYSEHKVNVFITRVMTERRLSPFILFAKHEKCKKKGYSLDVKFAKQNLVRGRKLSLSRKGEYRSAD